MKPELVSISDVPEEKLVYNPFNKIDHELLKKVMAEVLTELRKKERKILIYRFGLFDGNKHTLEQTAKRYGKVTRERIRQLEAKALKKLRHPILARRFLPFI